MPIRKHPKDLAHSLNMEVLGSDKGSDFITNCDFVPPSPPLDSVFDYPSPAFDIAPITSPLLPHTYSYNGSYNSPFHNTRNSHFQATIFVSRTLLWTSTNLQTRLINPLCWCSQTITIQSTCLAIPMPSSAPHASSGNRMSPSSRFPLGWRYDRRSSTLYRTRSSNGREDSRCRW